jgi:RNA polymerase sigma-70 factor (ECF subfamily)
MPDEPGLDAFERFFLRHYPRVCGVLCRLTGRPDEAEDLALEAFWRLWSRGNQVEGAAAEAWLYKVASNLGYNALRADGRRVNYEGQAALYERQEKDDSDPPEAYERQERIEQVRETLRRMAPRQARLLALRYSGLSYAELAGALGVAPGSIGTLLARAEAEFETLFQTRGKR